MNVDISLPGLPSRNVERNFPAVSKPQKINRNILQYIRLTIFILYIPYFLYSYLYLFHIHIALQYPNYPNYKYELFQTLTRQNF